LNLEPAPTEAHSAIETTTEINPYFWHQCCNSVSIVTELRAGWSDDWGSIPSGGWEFLFNTMSRLVLGPTQPLI